MKCPKCKKPVFEVPDANHVLKKRKLKAVAGWFCEWCALSFTVEK